VLQADTSPVSRDLPRTSRRRPAATAPVRLPVEWAVLAGDIATMVLALAATAVAFGTDPAAGLATSGFILAACPLLGHYATRKCFALEARQILTTTAVALGLMLSVRAVLGWPEPNTDLVWFAVAACLSLIAGRVILKYLLHRSGPWRIPTIVIGAAEHTEDLRLATNRNWYVGHVIDEVIEAVQPVEAIWAELNQRLRGGSARHIIIVFDSETCAIVQRLADHLDRLSLATYSLVPPFSGLSFAQFSLQRPFGLDGVMLHCERKGHARYRSLLKRAIDLVLASILLVALLPLLIVIGAIVRADGGPAIYASPRIGRNGREFKAYKFRSMVPDADRALRDLLANDPVARREWETRFKLTRDPRITPIGQMLRRTSLDELPQLVNVLRGDMSLVGPRPILPDECASYAGALALYRGATPGITGLWQVCGRDEVDYSRRIRLNNWYCRNSTIWNDFVILFRTAVVVLSRGGAS
jgi:undecaprenyl-phosphate galactose phosphotransferase